MRYHIEADFLLLHTCNFRCDYCLLPADALGSKIRVYGSNKAWEDGFAATGLTWLLNITGGEPSVYPDFADLCERLCRRHILSLNSNLSHRSIDTFAERVDPTRVWYIHAAAHDGERQKKGHTDLFAERVQRLRKTGFRVLVSIVATPQVIADFPRIAESFGAQGITLIPKVLRNGYKGVDYPAGYTAEEKAQLRKYLADAQHDYAAVLGQMDERPTIDIISDGRFLDGIPDYRGRLCGAGHNFVRINPSGNFFRCGTRQPLGNILLRKGRLLKGPQPCDTHYCPYFCEKYTSDPFVRRRSLSD